MADLWRMLTGRPSGVSAEAAQKAAALQAKVERAKEVAAALETQRVGLVLLQNQEMAKVEPYLRVARGNTQSLAYIQAQGCLTRRNQLGGRIAAIDKNLGLLQQVIATTEAQVGDDDVYAALRDLVEVSNAQVAPNQRDDRVETVARVGEYLRTASREAAEIERQPVGAAYDTGALDAELAAIMHGMAGEQETHRHPAATAAAAAARAPGAALPGDPRAQFQVPAARAQAYNPGTISDATMLAAVAAVVEGGHRPK
jgi:hypothetical protein